MTNSDALFPHLVESILRRLEALEARCSRLEAVRTLDRGQSRQEPSVEATADDPLTRLKAINDYWRLERVTHLKEHPATLAAIREDAARLNDYLVERGLRPLPDRYPELSTSAGTVPPAESGQNPAL